MSILKTAFLTPILGMTLLASAVPALAADSVAIINATVVTNSDVCTMTGATVLVQDG